MTSPLTPPRLKKLPAPRIERPNRPLGPVTAPQRRALDALEARGTASSRQIAADLWPDSPAWDRRTRGRSGNRNGALGGTMPMKAAQLLWKLQAHGLVRHEQHDGVTRWHALPQGEAATLTEPGGAVMPAWCTGCRDFGKTERHSDHWPPDPTPAPSGHETDRLWSAHD